MSATYLGFNLSDQGLSLGFSDNSPDTAIQLLRKRSSEWEQDARLFAAALDEADDLKAFRSEFLFPQMHGKDVTYLVGNSLGLQPRDCAKLVQAELDSWANRGVNGHFEGPKPWINYDDALADEMARVVGARGPEVALMNSLTVNLHLLVVRFFNAATTDGFRRRKILIEKRSFPSDFYAFESQLRMRGLDPAECLVEVSPREGEHCLRTEDILEEIATLGCDLAIVAFSGVQFYTGQLFDIEKITKVAHEVGAVALWDLAHAAGSVNLKLHEWNVDGACWCTYKYLNSGPGGIGGFFIHERNFNFPVSFDRLQGWWSHKESTRFEMSNVFEPSIGASEFRLSNVPILTSASLMASLQIFAKTDMKILRAKSLILTAFLEELLEEVKSGINPELNFEVITGNSRGAQLSILFKSDTNAKLLSKKLEQKGVMIDYRRPGLIRVAPAPLYCNFTDAVVFRDALVESICELDIPPI
jgi:kynureninase